MRNPGLINRSHFNDEDHWIIDIIIFSKRKKTLYIISLAEFSFLAYIISHAEQNYKMNPTMIT